jgi:hypothetical protein
MPPLEAMTLEQLLYTLPAFVYTDRGMGRMWLHLQPTLAAKSFNAFYGAVDEHGMGVHPILAAEGDNPRAALISLAGILNLARFSLEPDPNGEMEEASRKSKTLGEETLDK